MTTKTKSKPSKLSSMVKRAKTNRDNPAKGADAAQHLVINARAGTGKTFTLILAVAYCFRKSVWPAVKKGVGFNPQPSPQQRQVWKAIAGEKPATVTYIAFNRSIVDEFKTKWAWMVDALSGIGVSLGFSTIHQLGFRACCKAYKLTFRNINKWKTVNLLEAHLEQDIRQLRRERPGLVQAVDKLVGLCKINLAHEVDQSGKLTVSEEQLDALAVHYEVELGPDREDIFRLVPILLEESRTSLHEIDFNDQIWLPVVNDLPVYQSQLLLVDEGQDLNRCQQELALKAGRRIVLCGDPAQAIYGFAGADVDSIPRMTSLLDETPRGVQNLSLTVTRRCGKAIVSLAREIVPDFEAHTNNPPGVIRSLPPEKLKDELTDTDMVLCRVNAPLISLAFGLLRAGRKANIQGRDIGEGLKSLIQKSRCDSVNDFLEWLDIFQASERERLNRRRNPPEEALVALQDKVECLRIFCEGATAVHEVFANIDALFQDQNREGVLLSSVHRAKGLESDRVFILEPGLMPHPMAKTQWAMGQEQNLKYVAITRAIRELVWVV